MYSVVIRRKETIKDEDIAMQSIHQESCGQSTPKLIVMLSELSMLSELFVDLIE